MRNHHTALLEPQYHSRVVVVAPENAVASPHTCGDCHGLLPERGREHCNARLSIRACDLAHPCPAGFQGAAYGLSACGTNAETLFFRANRCFELAVRDQRPRRSCLALEREREHCKVRLNIQVCDLAPPVELGLGASYGLPARGTVAAKLHFRAHRCCELADRDPTPSCFAA